MNKVTDVLIASQLCTIIGCTLTFVAHLQSSGQLLNNNWDWLAILCVAIAMFFLLLPHLICHDKPTTIINNLTSFHETMSCSDIDKCHNEAVLEPDKQILASDHHGYWKQNANTIRYHKSITPKQGKGWPGIAK